MRSFRYAAGAATGLLAVAMCVSVSVSVSVSAQDQPKDHADPQSGKHLFERATFAGNGRTCSTCHSASTGTVSPEDAQRRFAQNPGDPLFVHDGSDDFKGHGA